MADDPKSTQQNTGTGAGQQPKDEKKHRVPDYIREKYPNLEQLINETESMTNEEREYWFQILPIMTDKQIQKLRGILIHEKEQLAKLDKEYETELSKLNQKHIMEWKEQDRKEKRDTLKKQEVEAEKEEKDAEAELLEQMEALGDEEGTEETA
ncbi:hypothetical protein HN748_02070 [Candidatus Peregrinibacteria bacterium]|jgi:hypothetical protein|nr:hypothetical protein [Candidatus Peregrinibacteria bacterium]MBT7483242.1 hypothetical protein [Candidatus Peregrinibacteria bacterium]MBT7702995.1 hypothetical protein [Candidatus Peregrinibacteria bacterium]